MIHKKNRMIFKGILLCTLFLSACSTTQKTATQDSQKSSSKTALTSTNVQTTSNNNKVQGYVFHSMNVVTFLQLTNKNGVVSGTMYERTEDQNNQLQIYNTSVTGQISGNTISLTLQETGHTFSGNLTGNQIDLAVPMNDGSMMTDVFIPGTINDFNKYVNQLKSRIADDQQQTQQAQQTQDLSNQLSSIEDAINKLVQSIPNDEKSLQDDVSSTKNDISSEQNDLESVNKDEQSVMKESASDPQTVADANQVGADANQVQADDNQISADNNQFQTDEKALQGDLSSLNTDFQKMTQLANQLNTSIPEYLPKQSDVTNITNKGQSTDQTTTNSINSYIAKSKQIVGTANGLAAQANKHANN